MNSSNEAADPGPIRAEINRLEEMCMEAFLTNVISTELNIQDDVGQIVAQFLISQIKMLNNTRPESMQHPLKK